MSKFDCILEVDPTGFSDRLDKRHEKMRLSKMIPVFMAGGTGRMALPSAGVGNVDGGAGFGGKSRCSV